MEWWREDLLRLCLLTSLSLGAGFAIMALHGLRLLRRQRRPAAHALADFVSPRVLVGLVSAAATSVLLASQRPQVPWTWLADGLLLTLGGAALVGWLGPPAEHVEMSRLCQIGRGTAYSHYYGYLRLMKGEHGVRRRLRRWQKKREVETVRDGSSLSPLGRSLWSPPGPPSSSPGPTTSSPRPPSSSPGRLFSPPAPPDWLDRFHTRAVFVLAPENGDYPDIPLGELTEEDMATELPGVSPPEDTVPAFRTHVGGNERCYGKFTIHRVISSDESDPKEVYVALDTIQALHTLSRLGTVKMVGIQKEDLMRQQNDMMCELRKIIETEAHLRGQIQLVPYKRGEHVGDKILQLLESQPCGADLSSNWGEVSYIISEGPSSSPVRSWEAGGRRRLSR